MEKEKAILANTSNHKDEMKKAESIKTKLLEQNKELLAEYDKIESEFKNKMRLAMDAEKKETSSKENMKRFGLKGFEPVQV